MRALDRFPSRRPRVRRFAAMAAAIAVAGAALAGCGTAAPEEDVPTTLVLGTAFGGTDYSDYISASLTFQKQAVFDYVMNLNAETTEFEPWIATDWSYNEDKTVLSLTFRDDVTFTDGTPVNAEAVKANFQHRVDAKDSFMNYTNIEGFEVTGEYTLEAHLIAPDDGFLTAVAQTPLAALASLEDPETMATDPITSGPYLIDHERTVPDVEWVYTRNEDYWNQEAYPFDEVVVKFLEDIAARVNALISGQVDYAPIDSASVATVEEAGLKILQTNSTSTVLFISDRAGAIVPALGDVRVRQAMNFAIDRDAIAEEIDLGFGDPEAQYFLEDSQFHVPDADTYSYDPDRARELLAEAGYPDGFDLTIPSILVPQYEPAVTQYLADVGIRVTFEVVEDQGAMYNDLIGGKFPAYLWDDLYFNTLKNLIDPNGIWNGSRYTTPRLAELLAAINGGTDEEATDARAELGEYVYDDAWFMQIAHPGSFQGLAAHLQATPPKDFGIFGPYLWDIQPAD